MATSGKDTNGGVSRWTRGRMGILSRTFGNIFKKNTVKSLPVSNLEEKEACSLGNCKCGCLCKVSLGMPPICDCELPCPLNTRIGDLPKTGRSMTCPPYCPGCDLQYTLHGYCGMKEYEESHYKHLCLPSQLLPNMNCCQESGEYPWKIYQCKDDWNEPIFCRLKTEILVHICLSADVRIWKSHTEAQAFYAATDESPSRILGFCVVEPMCRAIEELKPGSLEIIEKEIGNVSSCQLALKYLWVHLPDRRKGVAKSLADAARKYYYNDSTVPIESFGICYPTVDGLAFGKSYLGECHGRIIAMTK